MTFGVKTNERPGTRAVVKNYGMSAKKARVVLNLIRGEDVKTAAEILDGTTREAADVSLKVLTSAVANAVNNDGLSAETLYVSAAYADEGPTMKRFTPRARGRAGRINKRTCHITIIVSPMDEERLAIIQAARSASAAASRSRRVAGSKKAAAPAAPVADEVVEDVVTPEAEIVEVVETPTTEATTEETTTEANAEETTEETDN
jgi:large subunit ribosomal protein L22